ncbi:MAG: S8 family serine peptidase [Chloroflexota bacterium]|nr:S8 family serine peptidase [Chloroflexota bacterium]
MKLSRIGIGALVVALIVALLVPVAAPVGGTAVATGPEIDPLLTEQLNSATSDALLQAIVTYHQQPTDEDVAAAKAMGVLTHRFSVLPMIAVQGTPEQVRSTFSLPGVRSVYFNRQLEYLLNDSVGFIGADRVWSDLGYTGKGVGVAVIDSGVDATHPDLALGTVTTQNAKILLENFFTGESVLLENVPNSDTTSGHGTHVAGTIAGRGTASAGKYTGVAPGAHLIGIGVGEGLHILWALQGFDYAIANKDKYNIRVISNSWGTSGEFVEADPVNVASKTAYDNGMVVVFASGNAGPGENTLNPYSVAPWVIGVAAGCTSDEGVKDISVRCEPGSLLANFSSRGIPGDPLYHPTITAPGVWVTAARSTTGVAVDVNAVTKDPYCNTDPLAYYVCINGTSMATPHISGVAALMLEAKPGLHPDLIKEALTATAKPMTRPDGSLYEEWEVGAGYVDAYAAVAKAERMAPKTGTFRTKDGKTYKTYTETYTWSGVVPLGATEAGAGSHDYYKQDITSDAVSATVRVEWGDPVQDIDLYVKAPDGSIIGKSAQGVSTFEETTFSGEFLPLGTYTVDVEGWLTVAAPYDGAFTVEYVLGGGK